MTYKVERVDKVRKCPSCKLNYTGYPALSRKDNKTEICSECGQIEAMTTWKKSLK